MVDTKTKLASVAVAGALTALIASTPTKAPLAADMEKCYGVAKAGKNDCKAGPGTTCQGSSTRDGQTNAWILVPKGLCTKLVNGSLMES